MFGLSIEDKQLLLEILNEAYQSCDEDDPSTAMDSIAQAIKIIQDVLLDV